MFELTTWPRSAWSIFDELESLHASMNRAIRNQRQQNDYRGERYPLLNVWTSPEGLMVEADMPGVAPADVDIDLVGDELTISGKVNATATAENVVVHRQERPHGEFARKLKLPFRIDSNNVSAAFRNGVLRIKLPRSEEQKPRKIAVQAA
jgi:HSP20 family protein